MGESITDPAVALTLVNGTNPDFEVVQDRHINTIVRRKEDGKLFLVDWLRQIGDPEGTEQPKAAYEVEASEEVRTTYVRVPNGRQGN